MNTKMHGKPIQSIFFSGYHTEHGNPATIRATSDQTLHLSATHHGDHDQFWVVASKDGREVARYNVHSIDDIQWAPDSANEGHS